MKPKKSADGEILAIIDQISREKGISMDIMIEAIEAAVTSAARKHLNTEDNLFAVLDRTSGAMRLVIRKTIVEAVESADTQIPLKDALKLNPEAVLGEQVEIPWHFDGLSRIAAQAAKQVIVQRVREAERDTIFSYFNERVGQLVNGSVLRVEKGNIIVDLGRAEAILPKKEQSARDSYRRGERIRAYLSEVKKAGQEPQIILSRVHPNLLHRLFEMEVPEIYEGLVEIRGAAREPGERAKICVVSNDSSVDPVGACVGMKGARVQAIVKELRGENIDVVEWTDDTSQFIRNALSPAQVNSIYLDLAEKVAMVVVADQQLSLAIGKRGQNVRLAAKLTGWKIDIKSETEVQKDKNQTKQREDRLIQGLTQVPGVTKELVLSIIVTGYDSYEKLSMTDPDELVERIRGLDPDLAEQIVDTAFQLRDDEVLEQESASEPEPDEPADPVEGEITEE